MELRSGTEPSITPRTSDLPHAVHFPSVCCETSTALERCSAVLTLVRVEVTMHLLHVTVAVFGLPEHHGTVEALVVLLPCVYKGVEEEVAGVVE